MITALPNNMRAHQIEAQHPNAQYTDFHRQLISEQSRPLGMPYNAAAGDSSTYSFASGKLDNLLYYAGADVDREDCNDAVMDPLFSQWFREWLLTNDRRRGDEISDHQWDWPAHPVIDEVSHASANQTNLSTGQTTLSRVYSEDGNDFQDGLALMAEEWFGEASEANIAKARTICVLRNTPAHAINQVAAVLGVEMPKPEQPAAAPADTQEEQVAAYE
jgi:capsid protein